MNDMQLLEAKFPPRRFSVEGLIPDRFIVVAAKKGVGKSWFVNQIALGCAYNIPVANIWPAHQGNVILLALEDDDLGIQERLQSQMKALGITKPNGKLHVYTEFPMVADGGLERLENMIIDLRPRVVIIDMLRKFSPTTGAYNSASVKIDVINHVATKHRVSIIGVQHLYRGNISPTGADWVERVQGSIGLVGAAPTLLGLWKAPGAESEDGVLRTTSKMYPGFDVALKWDAAKTLWTGGGEVGEIITIGMSDIRKDIIDVIVKNQGATAEEIAKALDKDYDNIYQRLWQMVRRGQVVRLEGENDTQYVTEHIAEQMANARVAQQPTFSDYFQGTA